jgi:hypothetical protein
MEDGVGIEFDYSKTYAALLAKMSTATGRGFTTKSEPLSSFNKAGEYKQIVDLRELQTGTCLVINGDEIRFGVEDGKVVEKRIPKTYYLQVSDRGKVLVWMDGCTGHIEGDAGLLFSDFDEKLTCGEIRVNAKVYLPYLEPGMDVIHRSRTSTVIHCTSIQIYKPQQIQ